VLDADVYGLGKLSKPANSFALKYLEKKQRDIYSAISSVPRFFTLSPFSETARLCDGFIDRRVKMGEGWLLSAEMLELSHAGVDNIVCAQPFGCLPNHICGKGVAKQITEERPGMNVVAIDYDPGATQVNQENRLKLMLAAAFRNIKAKGVKEKSK
ncbi:MAG: 2-hydroxyglutaryl-CoA dehydratase, partial [Clostridia bacterium]|nr:2-hydroxyglutaryl-CoA dehydratase [Clostridia bacterium]